MLVIVPHQGPPPGEGGPGPVAAERLATVRVEEGQVVIQSVCSGTQEQDPVGPDAMPAVTPQQGIAAVRTPIGPTGSHIEGDEIVAGGVELDEVHAVKVRGGPVAPELKGSTCGILD